MSRLLRGGACAALIIILCLGLTLGASADFSDIEGHWAQSYLSSAVERGWLTGFDDGTMRPDAPITGAQAVTLITRILQADTSAEGDSWYAGAAAAAEKMGILPGGAELNSPLARREAFLMLAAAFQTYSADGDKTLLGTYADAADLTANEADAMAGLVNIGVVQGYNGSLNLKNSLTRGEFAALLSRLLEGNALDMDGEVSEWQGNILWIGCPANDVELDNLTANRVVIRSEKLKSLKITDCAIGELVLAQGGSATVKGGGIKSLRVAANDQSVTVGSKVDTLAVTGVGNTVTLSGGADRILIYGADTDLRGSGKFGETVLRAADCSITGRANKLTDLTDHSLDRATVKLEYKDAVLPAGETLTVTANVRRGQEGAECLASWYIDDEPVQQETVTLTGKDEFTLSHDYFYRRDMALDTTVRFVLSRTSDYGVESSVSAEYVQTIENHPEDWVFPMDPERVLALVTTEYAGDYTLEWAENHDYEDFEKEIWVNAKGFESDSQYLLWINQSHSRVNVFEGSQGNWKLIHSWIVSCGADATSTPRGVFKTTWNQPIWNFGTYDVFPIVRFKGGGYAFHSRLYYPGTQELMDGAIGYPASHGCIRMYLEDIQWIYDNVPSGTTVVSY